MIYLAIDQGGTKTCAMACDETGHILGVGYGRGSCWSVSGAERALAACEEALAQMNLSWRQVDRLSAGMTGLDWPQEYEVLRECLAQHTGIEHITLINDCEAAFWGGTKAGYGVCVCAGTGTNACMVQPDGHSECLGYYVRIPHLAREGIHAAIDHAAGIAAKTALTGLLLEHFQATNMDEIVFSLCGGRYTAHKIKSFAPIVLQSAAHDPVAAQLCNAFAARCANYAAAMLRRGSMSGDAADAVVSGGIFKEESGRLFAAFSRALKRLAPAAQPVNAAYEPAVGAMRLLLTPEAWATLQKEAPQAGLYRLKG